MRGERYYGLTWQAYVTREPYGFHVTVSARRRKPRDTEIEVAIARVAVVHPEVNDFEEIPNLAKVNPYTRHFTGPEMAAMVRERWPEGD